MDFNKLIIEIESFQFEDGNDISVQIGGGNYCVIKDAEGKHIEFTGDGKSKKRSNV